MSHVVFLNLSIESLSKNPSHVTYGVTKIQEHSISLKNRHMSHMVFLNFSIESLFLKKPSHVTYGVIEFY